MSTRPMHSSPETFQLLQDLYFEGDQLSRDGKFEEAVVKFTEGIQIDDHYRYQYVTQYAMRAWCYLHLNKFDEAIPDLEKAIEMEPEFHHADYYFKLARCYQQKGDSEPQMLQAYAKSIELNPKNVGAYYYRGLYFYEREQYPEAFPDIEKVISLDPKTGEGLLEIRNYLRDEIGLTSENSDDPEIFPGQPISKLSDYVSLMKKIQQGDMNAALSDYKLDIMQYSTIAQQWGAKMSSDTALLAKYAALMAN